MAFLATSMIDEHPNGVHVEDADAQPSPPAQQSQCIDSTMLDFSTRQ